MKTFNIAPATSVNAAGVSGSPMLKGHEDVRWFRKDELDSADCLSADLSDIDIFKR